MSFRSGRVLLPAALGAGLCVMLLTSCDREDRRFRDSPPGNSPTAVVRLSSLQPGPGLMVSHVDNEYEENAYSVAQGLRFYVWYNCNGCHAMGGGGMGPPLMDAEWVYGSAPEQVYSTIMEGRPNGMPSWAGRIPESQVWQIVAYVRSMSALNTQNVRAARSDHMMTYPKSQTLMDPKEPRQSYLPPASTHP